MRAVAYMHSLPIDDIDSLQDMQLPEPRSPRGRDLLVEIRAVSVNPVDFKVRQRTDPAGEPKILGFDAAGVVREAGPQARLFRAGDAVFYAGSIARPGTNAELHLVDERIVGPKPRNLSFAEAAAVPLTAITAWEALFDRLRIPRGGLARPEAVLVIGGAGGVGSMAVQLLRQLTGFTVVATASRPETQDWARRMGAHHVVDHAGSVLAQLRALNLIVPYVFVTTHTEAHWPAVCEILSPQGAVCLIDDPATPPDIRLLKVKAASVHWELMFTRPMFDTPDVEDQHRILEQVSRMLEAGTLRSTLTEQLGAVNAANLRRAHTALESGHARGKLVLEGFGP
ncbi:zinc-binding alcohol dehydrogenase family protein [Falsiroseomonas oryzae]|uniref:zinc-binding alcohol dehydrogenase family protein n=1 Tax=Falsiroseomonas oryzae TaxID=2766473 RepID=UPI0022EA40FA|nr:zinc-binding alcohol dehydrogenase family protein [Roseomonas sp. MO-31]